MTTTGTAIFGATFTGLDLINQALQDVGKLQAGQVADAYDQTDCMMALNLIVKSLSVEGFQLWVYQTISFPFVASQASYTIAPSGANIAASRPVRIMQAWVRDTATPPNDRPLTIIGRYDYNLLTPKATPGVPVNLYYDPQINTGVVYVWPTPADATLSAYMLVQRQIQDMSTTATFDFPQEYFQALRYLLAADIGPKYGCPERTQNRLDQKAEYYRTKMADFNTAEEPSVTFMPNFQLGMGRNG